MGNRKRSQDSIDDPADWDPNFSDELLFEDHGGTSLGGNGGGSDDKGLGSDHALALANQAAAYAAQASGTAAHESSTFGGFPLLSSSAPLWQSAGMTGKMTHAWQQFGFDARARQAAAASGLGGDFGAFVQQPRQTAAAAAAAQYGQLAAGFAQEQEQEQEQEHEQEQEPRR
jgi:hypothetical protein